MYEYERESTYVDRKSIIFLYFNTFMLMIINDNIIVSKKLIKFKTQNSLFQSSVQVLTMYGKPVHNLQKYVFNKNKMLRKTGKYSMSHLK